MIKLNRLAAALLAIGAASPSKASLITVDLDKTVEYTQSSANGPLTLNGTFSLPALSTEIPGIPIVVISLIRAPAARKRSRVFRSEPFNPASAGYLIAQSGFFATEAAFHSACPSGNYLLSLGLASILVWKKSRR